MIVSLACWPFRMAEVQKVLLDEDDDNHLIDDDDLIDVLVTTLDRMRNEVTRECLGLPLIENRL